MPPLQFINRTRRTHIATLKAAERWQHATHLAALCRWDVHLAGFLKALVKYWGKRLVFERSPADPSAHQAAPAQGRPALTEAMNQQLADIVIQLASRAQYAKVHP